MPRFGSRAALGLAAAAALIIVATGATAQDGLSLQHQRLAAARVAAREAAANAAALDRAADEERGAAAATRAREAAVAARIVRAEADVAVAQARVALIGQMLADQHARLAEQQRPITGLLAALQSLARRPTIALIAQPGSVTDLVRVRAVLSSVAPAVRQRTAALRADLDATAALRARAALAARSLADGRQDLQRERGALADLQARHVRRAIDLDRGALDAADRAIAAGEAARDIAETMNMIGGQATTAAKLVALPTPPFTTGRPIAGACAYRLPVAGRLVTGLGEMSASGVRSRGLTFAVLPDAPVLAPAGGRVVFARRFRGYRTVVILDHGAGWTTLLTGLGRVGVRRGDTVESGALVGRAARDLPEVTVELRRHGRAFDLTALLG